MPTAAATPWRRANRRRPSLLLALPRPRAAAFRRYVRGARDGLDALCDDPRIGGNHARAYAEVGVREVACVGPCAPPWPHPVSKWDTGRREERLVTFDEALAGTEAVLEAWHHGADDRNRRLRHTVRHRDPIDP